MKLISPGSEPWVYAALSSGTQYDPGLQLDGAITDLGAGTGLRIPLLGSVGSTDVSGGFPVVVIPLPTTNGRYDYSIDIYAFVRGLPGDTSDTDVYVGLSNESDNQASATIDAKYGGLRFGSSTKTTYNGRVTNGTTTLAAGTAATTIRRFALNIPVTGTTGLIPGGAPVVVGHDTNGAYASARSDDGTTGVVIGTATKSLVIHAGRTNVANAGAATVDLEVWYRLNLAFGLGT